jgi:flagellar biosynthesis protein FliR
MPLTDAWLNVVLQSMTQTVVAFTLIVTRLSGMMVIAPMFAHPDLPRHIRALLVIALGFVLTPALRTIDAQALFHRLDANGDGQIVVEEVPEGWQGTISGMLHRLGRPENGSLFADEFHPDLPLPRSVVEYAGLATIEFTVGLALGLGVFIILSGLQMAGNFIDQQIGVSLGDIFNPEFQTNATLSGQMLHLLGLALFLTVGGHLLLVSALVQTFQVFPVGHAFVSVPVIDLLRDLVHQSLVLAIHVSAPLMLTMAIVGFAMGILGHTIPQINILVVGFPVRALVGLAIFGLAIPNIAEVLTDRIPETVHLLLEAVFQ